MKAKRVLALVLAMVMVLALFSGCKKTETPTKDPAKDPVTDKPVEKNRTDIVIGSGSDVVSPDPHNQNDTSSGRVLHMMFDTLVSMDGDGKFNPMLAESWESPSDTEYIFKLRKDVKFHNGEAMKASDVKYSLERCAESAMTKQAVESIKSVEAVDDYTVKITTLYPFAPFMSKVAASTKCAILPEAYTKEKGDKFKDAPIGTGPMKYDSWTPNNSFKVVRNDDYWNGQPKTTSITIRVIPEATSLTIALETGEVDFVESVIAIDAKRVRENPKLKTVDQVQGSVTYAGMNYLVKPFDDLRVRKALAYAINRQNIVDVILEGNGSLLNTVFPPMMPGYDSALDLYPFNPEKAKALLAEAGFASGLKIEIATSGDERNRIAQLMQADYANIGVELDIQLLEWGAYLEYVSGKTHQMWILGWSNAYEPDGNMFDVFHKDRPSTTNRSHYKNDEVSKLIEDARQELDWAKRETMYKDLQKRVMEDPVWIPLFAKTGIIGMNKNMEGVVLEPITEFTYVNAYVKE